MKITYAVSLGSAGELSYNLRRHFNFRTAFPLDWWRVSFRGALDALNPQYDPYADLVLNKYRGRGAFVRTRDGNIEIDHELSGENWRDQIGTARTRFTFLRDRLLALNSASSTILFGRHEGNGEVEQGTNPATIDDLIAGVKAVFNKSLNIFLLLNTPRPKWPERGVFPREIARTDTSTWVGDPATWDAALADFTLENLLLPPFSGGYKEWHNEVPKQGEKA
jgi:hypothetical protein